MCYIIDLQILLLHTDMDEQLCLLDLPVEILIRILKGMQMPDILNLAKVNPIKNSPLSSSLIVFFLGSSCI